MTAVAIDSKAIMVEAYSLIYDIETTLKHLLYSKLYLHHFHNNETYNKILNLVEMNDLLSFSDTQYETLRKTHSIRNKVCHMRSISQEDLALLKEVHHLLESTSKH
ncbi:hypothetical protein ACERJO_11845 [Halalkalibacter sp. AB-rgal2]|uniref:hypothetical protein n=1 Tax=Halalkalibacter sp. AB-rgal2 TaxID=3242695 RepID=UPI00359DB535